jgi:pilus assembly protein Flp/PilA
MSGRIDHAIARSERDHEMSLLNRFSRDQSGATAIEYGLIAAIIGVGIVASLSNIRDAYTALYNKINNGLNS